MRAFLLVAVVAACGGGSAGGDGGNGGGDGHGSSGGDGGHADAMVDAAPLVCGDGMRVRGEECDDHNTTSGDGCDATCRVEPYAGAPQAAIDAMHAMNALRAQADLPGAHLESHIVMSAQNHATYYSTNYTTVYQPNPTFSAHSEMSGYPGYTGVQFNTRMSVAGFTGNPMFETMAFVASPAGAISGWLNTVFHRVPMLHPNMTQFGYANASGHANDVTDYASGAAETQGAVVLWPPPGATNVPRSFSTTQEGPQPPAAPGGGTTTGPLISVLFASGANGAVTSETVKVNGAAMPTTVVDKNNATFGPFMMGSYCFYTDPTPAGATITVDIAGTVNGAAFTRSWSFTTQ